MHFFSGGGFPFGGFGGPEEEAEQTLYDILEVSKEATAAQIEQAYKRLAEEHKQDEQKVEELKQAYDILTDAEKRKDYDEQVNQQEQIMKMMFGQAKKQQQKPKVKPKKVVMDVTLQQVYKGELLHTDVKRYRICEGCKGKGGEDVKDCSECDGKGVMVKLVQVAPGMYSQMQEYCSACKGKGELFDEQKKCKDCNGEKVLQKEVKLPVTLNKGSPHGSNFVIADEGDEVPDALPGDVVVVFNVKPHDVFTVDKANLVMKKKITLTEALTGFWFSLTHLDMRGYRVQTQPGEVLADKCKRILKGLGLPQYKKESHFGDLVIEFEVVMPETIKPQNFQELAKILGGGLDAMPTDDKYQMLEDFDPEDLNTNEEGGRRGEDEEEGEGQGVTCATG